MRAPATEGCQTGNHPQPSLQLANVGLNSRHSNMREEGGGVVREGGGGERRRRRGGGRETHCNWTLFGYLEVEALHGPASQFLHHL